MSFDDLLIQTNAILHAPLISFAGTTLTLSSLLGFLVIFAVTLLVSRVTQKAIVRGFKARGVVDEGTVGTTNRLVHYAILALGLGVGLDTESIKKWGQFHDHGA